jgi:hypothetical protein
MPKNAPSAKAASVKAGNTSPRASNTVSVSTFICSVYRNGWKNQANSSPNAPARTARVTPTSASFAIACRSRPRPCVHAYR